MAAAHDLSTRARRLTAERGLSGFTVEELCDAVGVSRRTFFNYFAGKEDAVLGRSPRRDDADLVAAFLAGGGCGGTPSPDLLDELATLAVGRWDLVDISAESVADLVAAMEREPRLLSRLVEYAQQDEAADAALVRQREGLPEADLRAATAAQLMATLVRAAASDFLGAQATGRSTRTFADLLGRRLQVARQLLGRTAG